MPRSTGPCFLNVRIVSADILGGSDESNPTKRLCPLECLMWQRSGLLRQKCSPVS
jgi:hypothetical protein